MHPRHFDSHDDQMDGFDRLPNHLILLIFNQLSDIKTLARCRSVSKRFNSLVPQVENLLIKVDCVISTEPDEWFLSNILKSVLQSLQYLILPKQSCSVLPRIRSSPAEILRGFEKIRRLELELPSGDLRLEKGIIVRWKAVFGRTLKSCVILAVRNGSGSDGDGDGDGDDDYDDEIDFDGGMKLRVVWTINALIAASARHYLLREVIREHKEIENLVLRDREGEGTVVMGKEGLKELREGEEEGEAYVSTVGWKNRTTVPAVRMRMRHVSKLELGGGVRMRGVTLVVVRPMGMKKTETEEDGEDRGCALGVFGGMFEEAVVALLKRPSYLLEMNSF